ncbi:hypothetical protein [Methylomonas sp. UP202]|uniref:hypothetical protein n=1 Tax=Methylomonas sp. UP202 TaxID=3040943 RepID=UPI00247AC6BA|nr:hypothetical protein [Methylomonas sp. UP202]WGS85687.1 hypothetical protein QC632_22045 [Methylomonas sp. UP202]
MKVRVLMYLMCGLLWGCSTGEVRRSAWSEDMPAQAGFAEHYQRDRQNAELQSLQEYLTWVERFYRGWDLYPTGWIDISRDLTTKLTDPSLKNQTRTKLARLGAAIAAEWAKDNTVRRITTRHIGIWGEALRKSAERAELPSTLDRVLDDVDNLLNSRIAADVITENRFYIVDDVLNEIH